MAGRQKEGIEFSGWATDVFEDPKIDKLIDGQGVAGFTCIAVGIKSGFVLAVESLGKCQRQLSKRITRLVQILRTECQNAAQRPGIQ